MRNSVFYDSTKCTCLQKIWFFTFGLVWLVVSLVQLDCRIHLLSISVERIKDILVSMREVIHRIKVTSEITTLIVFLDTTQRLRVVFINNL